MSCQDDLIHPEAVAIAEANSLTPEVMQELLAIYKAISDQTRFKILWFLMQHELCVCDLCYLLEMNKSAVSHQLKYLRQANLVKKRKEGRVVFYSIADQHVKDIITISLQHAQEGEPNHEI